MLLQTHTLASLQTHTNIQEFGPHGSLWRHDGNRRRWADKDITTAWQAYRSLWDSHSEILLLDWFLFCFFLAPWNSISLMFSRGKKRTGEAQISKNVNECQISKFGPFLHPRIICKTHAAKMLIRWEWEKSTKQAWAYNFFFSTVSFLFLLLFSLSSQFFSRPLLTFFLSDLLFHV